MEGFTTALHLPTTDQTVQITREWCPVFNARVTSTTNPPLNCEGEGHFEQLFERLRRSERDERA